MRLQKICNQIISNGIKCFITCLFLSTFCTNATAQSGVNYTYDLNGNRTSEFVNIISHAPVYHNTDSNKNDSNKAIPTIKVYPNPTTAQVNVSISSFQNCEFATIYLSDASGNLLTTIKTTSTLVPINLNNYNQSTFYLRIILCDDEYSYTLIKLSPRHPPTSPPAVPK
jgi:hypothetical protein